MVPLLKELADQVVQSTIKDGIENPRLYAFTKTLFELPLLVSALEATRNNQSRTARLLGISRGTLRSRLKKYKLGNENVKSQTL